MDTMDVNGQVLEMFNQEEVPVKVLKEFEINTYAKGHHIYKDIWTLGIGESLDAKIEPNNPEDKYAAGIQKSGKVVGHLQKEATGRFAKTRFFFLKGDPYSKEKTRTSRCRYNLGDSEGLQVPCN